MSSPRPISRRAISLPREERRGEQRHSAAHLAESGERDKDAIRNVSVSLIRLGDVKRAQGDGGGARRL